MSDRDFIPQTADEYIENAAGLLATGFLAGLILGMVFAVVIVNW